MTEQHKLIGNTLIRGPNGIDARCECGWVSAGHFSSFAASAAFVDHQEREADVKAGEYEPGNDPCNWPENIR